MEEYEATFEIQSKSDAHAVERMMERLYDAVREESRSLRADTIDSSETLEQFEGIRDATRRPSRGRLTVVYERHGERFEE